MLGIITIVIALVAFGGYYKKNYKVKFSIKSILKKIKTTDIIFEKIK
jgi:hypothetical protein